MATKTQKTEVTHPATQESKAVRPQTFNGVVVKSAMKDTATVAVSRYVKHPKYKKYQVRTKKFLVEDTGNTAKIGDQVTIEACRPLSKLKHFRLIANATPADTDSESE
jgi:small subunit ribosomal protein S17